MVVLSCQNKPTVRQLSKFSKEDLYGELDTTLVDIELVYYGMQCPCSQWATKEDIDLYERLIGTPDVIPMDSLFMLIIPENEQLPNPFELNYSSKASIFNFTGHFYKSKFQWKSENGIDYNCRVFQYQKVQIAH